MLKFNCNVMTILGVILRYDVQVTVLSGVGSDKSLSVDNPGIVVEMLSCCSDYTFSVTARNSAGPGTSSDVMFSTPEPNARKHIYA